MKTQSTLIFFLFVFLLAFNDVSLAAPRVPSAPDPITQTPYGFTEWDYRVSYGGKSRNVDVFAPTSGGSIISNRPLVLILHGFGYSSLNPGDSYRELGIHLARNGFFVIKPDWDSGDYASAGTTMEKYESAKHAIVENIRRVYQHYGSYLSDEVVLIGHSVGGAGVVRYADEVLGASPNGRVLRVKSVVSMAPSTKDRDITQNFNFYNVADSLLVMNAMGDGDVWGHKYDNGGVNNGVMQTGVKVYDSAGTQNTIYYPSASRYPTKDMITFYKEGSPSTFDHAHFAKDNVGFHSYTKDVNGYINAYLRLHVYGDQRYNRYFKHEQQPRSLSSRLRVIQSHGAQEKRVVANFSRRSKTNFYGGSSSAVGTITVNRNSGEMNIDAGRSWQKDDFSPHKDNVLNVSWDRQGARGSSRLSFNYHENNRPDIREYNYLSFRITQRSNGYKFLDYYNPNGESLDFRIRLFTTNHGYSKAIYISDHAEAVPYPEVFEGWVGFIHDGRMEDLTKHTMRTVLIPLSAFEKSNGDELNLGSLSKLKFYFYGKGRITIDNIEFIK